MNELVMPLVVVLLIYKVALAILLIEGAYRLRDGRHERPQPWLARLLRLFGSLLFVLHLTAAPVVAAEAAVVLVRFWFAAPQGGRPGEWLVSTIGLVVLEWLVAAGFCYVGFCMHRVAAAIGTTLSPEEEATFRSRLRLMTLTGWGILVVLVLGPLVLATAWLLNMFVAVFGAIGLLVLAGAIVAARIQHNRIQQTELLWILAIAAQRGLSLPEEIESYARWLLTPDRFHWRPWRYLAWPWTRAYQRRLLSLAGELRRGISLPEALRMHSDLVPSLAATAARAGASTGTLKEALAEAATRHTQALTSTVVSPLASFVFYVYLLVSVMTSIVLFQVYYIVPKFKKIFEHFGVEPPAITLSLFRVGDFMLKYFVLLVPGAVLLLAGLLVLAGRAARGQLQPEWLTAWLGRWFVRRDTPEILRALARFTRQKRSVGDGLKVLAERCFGSATRARLQRVQKGVSAGQSCWTALEQAGLIHGRERALLQAAERTGNLPWALEQTADRIQQHRQYRLACWLETVRPALTIALGALVAWVCVAFLLSLVKLVNELF